MVMLCGGHTIYETQLLPLEFGRENKACAHIPKRKEVTIAVR